MSDSDAPELESGPIAWMARNPIAANLLMVLLLAGGFWTASQMQKEVEPEYLLDIVEVSVTYPGAAPAEVESGILLPIEESVRAVQGIKEITSEAREGSGTVTIELVVGTDRVVAFQDIDQAVSRIRTFPDDADEPEVRLEIEQREVMELGLFGEVDPWTLRLLAERLRDRLLSNPAITQVQLGRVPAYETHVEISQSRLREHDLTLGEVAEVIGSYSEDIPAGDIQTSGGEILLRVKERKQWAREFAEIPLMTSDSGAVVKLGDIASVRDGFEESGFHSQFNATPSVEVEIYRVGKQSPLEISEAVLEVMEEFEAQLPEGVNWRVDGNAAEEYDDRLSLLLENAGLAIVIVLLILSLFLEIRLAFWVMMGMTISFVGAIVFLPMVGVSINMVSMFGFLVVLGIVVDDAIVVGENVYEHQQQGGDRLTASIAAAREISRPVTFSILTNIVAFVPLLFIPGTTGKYWWPLAAVVIIVLAVSLFEALFILPAHLGHEARKRGKIERWLDGKQSIVAAWLNRMIKENFGPILDRCLKFRYVTVAASVGLLIVVGGYGYSGHMGMIMMPEVAADEIEAGVRLPVGTTPDQAGKVASDITESTLQMFDEHDLYRVADGVKTNVRGGNFIDVEIVLKAPDERDMSADEIIEFWRDQIGEIEGVDQITFEAERGPGGWRKDIEVDLSHNDIDVLETVAKRFVEDVERYEATRDVTDNFNRGKVQFDLKLRPEARGLGLTADDVGQQVRDAFFGALATRQLRGTNEFEVRVKLPESERKDLYFFDEFVVQTPDGIEVPLYEVVDVSRVEAFSSISRRGGRRVVTVSNNVRPKSAIGRVIESLNAEDLPALRADYPGLTWSFEGSQAEMRESTDSLWGGFLLAMAVIFSLLAVAFRSYVQPLIVLSAIPFGIIGAVIGHILLGHDLSLMSVMGIIALSGVVVNDSLIMIDLANRERKSMSAFDAIHKAGSRRFRPIMLTTLTTFGGLSPIIFETSNQANHLIPMAISLGFGIVFATGLILVLVPCFYLIVDDLTILGRRVFK